MMEFVNGKDDIPCMKWKIKNVFSSRHTAASLGRAELAGTGGLDESDHVQGFP